MGNHSCGLIMAPWPQLILECRLLNGECWNAGMSECQKLDSPSGMPEGRNTEIPMGPMGREGGWGRGVRGRYIYIKAISWET